jgi:hypothetical protein
VSDGRDASNLYHVIAYKEIEMLTQRETCQDDFHGKIKGLEIIQI